MEIRKIMAVAASRKRSRFKRAGRALVVGASATACLALMSGVAEAKSWGPYSMVNIYDQKIGTAQFVANGDSLTVCDTRADSYAPKVRVYRASDHVLVWTVTANLGKGWCVKSSKNLGETTKYEFWNSGTNQNQLLATTTAG
ncbi:hypothetical protein M2164_000141 [Streptomyces sp. SAI-208]|uniref:hypothetical protein n=1 Tax=Streptomyces sp. SAI-208 TaxID=2940550 RepID=UPI00247680B3|nr:hypothetical protein [Streptomyces sp. SAI-208]MDH6604506.1 hypothetical protein [Streptomyces sp. SAI-208]